MRKDKMTHIKRISLNLLVCFLTMVLTSFLSGCALSTPESNFSLFYLNKDITTVVERPYMLTSVKDEDKVAECLEALSTNPSDVEVLNPIRDNVGVNGFMYSEEGIVNIDFDSGYFQAGTVEDILRRAAVVRTLCQIGGVDGVRFSVDGAEITDSKLNPIGIMTADMFINNEGKQINTYEKTTITLYFADESGTMLIRTAENVAYSSNIAMERIVMEQLIRGPLSQGKYYATIPANVSILSITTKDGTCYVSLSNAFLIKVGNVSDEAVLYSIVNSLTELPNINKVQIMIDGETEISFGDHSYLNTPLERYLDIVK
ncbi:MAG: GerMN domain-containing protein [Lachnospiraceae bacterium]|nr:GerMN domain-containing protein [Lachnospiraceae bacterium]